MNSKKIIWILGICLLAAACQKRKYPEEDVKLEREDIYTTGYIGNEPIMLKIGTDGYYCYSSYEQRPDSVYMFKGELKKFNCTTCSLALRLQLSDYKQRLPGASVVVDSSLGTGSRSFMPGIPIPHTFRFVSHSNKNIASVRWDFSNGLSSMATDMNYEFGQPGPQTVSLTITTKENCESKVVNKIFIGGESGFFACGVTLSAVQGNTSGFKADILGGKKPYTYRWTFGDGGTSNDADPTHSYTWAGSYPVKVQITDAENHVCESNYIHVAGNDQSSCSAYMSLSHESSRFAFLNSVNIQWTDASNITLRSDSITQPAGSYFEVLNSQPYEQNERGETGRLLTLRFNVLLANGNRKVWFRSENTAIAVTYK